MIRRGALRTWRTDAGAALLLALGTVPYVAVWPRDFVPGDEGLFLYEAKRILEGDVIYRDFFEVIAPWVAVSDHHPLSTGQAPAGRPRAEAGEGADREEGRPTTACSGRRRAPPLMPRRLGRLVPRTWGEP